MILSVFKQRRVLYADIYFLAICFSCDYMAILCHITPSVWMYISYWLRMSGERKLERIGLFDKRI